MLCATSEGSHAPDHGFDKYGRMLADVLLVDGTNVNHTLVQDGWCWWYRKYAPGDRCRKSWRKQRERPRKACGPTRTPCRRGNGEKEAVRTSGKSLCYRRCCDRDYLDFELCLPPLPFHEILRHSQPDLSFWSSHKEITQKFALIVLLPLSAPMVRPTVTGFFVPVKSAPVPSTVNS